MRTLNTEKPTDRVGRYPKHTFMGTSYCYDITPFHISRVLPGETLANIYFEARAKAPHANSYVRGCKMEYFFFYVRATDLALEDFKNMFIDPENRALENFTTMEEASPDALHYCQAGGVNWTKHCLRRVTESYFRDEGEQWDAAVSSLSGLPLAQVREASWLDSLTDKDDMPEGAALASATDAGDLERLMDAFEQLRALGLSNMTYEDWLRSNGIHVPGKDEGRPELLCRFSDFVYPATTVDVSDGDPKASYSFSFKTSSKERYFFKEPGFIIGITVARPKVFFGLQGSMCSFATRAWDWSPNYMRQSPASTLRRFAAGTGPHPTSTDDYFVDMTDDLTHGDQFIMGNYSDDGIISSPHPDPSQSYKYTDDGGADGGVIFRHDGFVSMTIKGFERDNTEVRRALG